MLTSLSTFACTSFPDGIVGFFLVLMAMMIWAVICVFSLFG